MKLDKVVSELIAELEEKEKRQDVVLQKNRQLIRDCARAIKFLHTGDLKEAEKIVSVLDKEIAELKRIGEGFDGITQSCYQEYAEIKCLIALLKRGELPDHNELGIPALSFLNGLAYCSGELRRAIQLALRDGDKKQAEYLFKEMNAIYDNLMTIKFSSSLVGGLRRKQDVLRGQIEQARSEMLHSG